MKAAVAMNPKYYVRRPQKAKAYPNAADRRVTAEKVIDTLLGLAIAASVVTALMFILALG